MRLGCEWRLGEHPEMYFPGLWIFLFCLSPIVFWTCLTFCSKLLQRVPQSHILFFWHLLLFVFSWALTNWICCGINYYTRMVFAAFSPSQPLLTSLWILQVSIIPSSAIPLPGWIPTCPFSPYSNAINSRWIIPSVMDFPWSFHRIIITWPEPHTIFKMWGHYP